MIDSKEAKEVETDPHIVFLTRNQRLPYNSTMIFTSGRCLSSLHKIDQNRYVVGLSTHSDLDGLLWYIERSKAKLVLIDGSRHDNAHSFSRLVERELNIKCASALQKTQKGGNEEGS